jgi:hypothetical protein
LFFNFLLEEELMKKYLVGIAILLCCGFVAVAAQVQFDLGATQDGSIQKPPPLPRTAEDGDFKAGSVVLQGGEDCAGATAIASLPFEASGTTVGYADDYDEACPFTDSTAPDVVYSFTPASAVTVDASLCTPGTNTDYDTKLFVYENSCPDGLPFGCNDDACSAPYYATYVSEITDLALTAGNTYYFVVDGYGGGSGDYTLSITEAVPPPICDCTGTEVPEGEANCGNPDTYNGGCNQDPVYNPATFTTVSCNTSYCGTTGADGETRDTDWFLLNMPQVDNVHVTLTAAYPMFIFEIDIPAYDCAAAAVVAQVAVDACVPGTMDFTSVAGDNFIWIGPQEFDGIPCPTDYIMEITCDVVPVGLQSFLIE